MELQSDVPYEWSVAVVPDPDNRSKDVIAKGVIKRITPPADVATRTEKASDLERASDRLRWSRRMPKPARPAQRKCLRRL